MKVYHGSTYLVESPLVNVGRPHLDFGPGFYVTDLKSQAVSWACRPLNEGKVHYLNSYNLDFDAIRKDNIKCLIFPEYSGEWLDFVISNRRGDDLWKNYSLIEGGIANDHVFNTIELYSNELISRDEALNRLKYEKPNHQICINNQGVLDTYLHFISSEIVEQYGK